METSLLSNPNLTFFLRMTAKQNKISSLMFPAVETGRNTRLAGEKHTYTERGMMKIDSIQKLPRSS